MKTGPQEHPMSENEKPKITFFYHAEGPLGCLGQFYPAPFTVEGISYKTSEQYMCAKRALLFGDLAAYEAIMKAETPKEAKAIGNAVTPFDEDVWAAAREEIVYNGNLAKFSQNEEMKQVLLATGDTIIAEASPNDANWGIFMREDDPGADDPANWPGKNLLGKAIQRVRETLKAERCGFEKSCGYVPFRRDGDTVRYLLIRSLSGVYGFPKGHIELGETEDETADRELREEAGISVRRVEGFRSQIEYALPKKPGMRKKVVFFLGECSPRCQLRCQENEIAAASFVTYEEALKLLTREGFIRVLNEADAYLKSL